MFYVYKITNTVNGKLYIGKAENVTERWQKHVSHARTMRGFILHNAIRKYGEKNFEVSIMEECKTDEEASEREIFWVAVYKTNIYRHGSEFGYNMTDGGEGMTGHHHSDDTKRKMSEASKGKPKSESHKKQLSIAHVGMKLMPEHKANIGRAGIGRKHTKIAREKLSASKIGENNSRSILDSEKVRDIKILLLVGQLSIKEIATKYGVASRTIRDIKNKKTWCHLK